jgi:hypothetical protein
LNVKGEKLKGKSFREVILFSFDFKPSAILFSLKLKGKNVITFPLLALSFSFFLGLIV